MTENHPIIPPPHLIEQWMQDHSTKYALARQAAQWGADTELEACTEVIADHGCFANPVPRMAELRAARRPKPPSLKEQALQALNDAIEMADDTPPEGIRSDQAGIIRRALESIPDPS